MTEKSEKPFGHSAHSRRAVEATKRLEILVQKLMAEGVAEVDAREQAMATMRANGRGDWRAG